MTHFFYWDDWNREHLAKHRVSPLEAADVVRGAKRPYPRALGNGKYQIKGPTLAGRRLHVVYVFKGADQIDIRLLTAAEQIELMESGVLTYIIHARDLRSGE
jgi:hypothetical protein